MTSEFQEPSETEEQKKRDDVPGESIPDEHQELPGKDGTRQSADNGIEDPDEALERRLSEPVLKGEVGIESAQSWIAAFLVAMAGLIAYSNAFTVPFHADDIRFIEENVPSHSLATLPAALIDGAPGALTMASFALNWSVSPGSPLGFHIVNIVLHILNGALVFFLCRRLSTSETPVAVPLVAALLFVLHPLATESVNYVVGRAALLATFFTLSSVLLYLRATEDAASIGLKALGWSLLCAFLAWTSDRAGIVAPALILILEIGRTRGESVKWRWQPLGAYLALMLALVIYESVAEGRGIADRTILSHALTCGLAIVRSIQLTLAPMGLTVDHALPVISETWEQGALPSLALVLVILAAGIVMTRLRSLGGIAILWLLAASVVAYLLGDDADAYNERRSYLALAGIVLIIPWIVGMATPYKNGFRNATLGITAAALVLGATTFIQNRVWLDGTTLWANARAKNPESPRALKWLAHSEVLAGQRERVQSIQFEQQQQQAAMAASQERALTNFRQAEDRLNEVINLYGGDAETYRDLGYALRGLNRPDEAIEALMNALRLDTQNQQITFSIAGLWDIKAFASLDRFEQSKAIEYFRRAEALGPLTDQAMIEYGLALGSGNQWNDAVARLQTALQNRPDSPVRPRLEEFNRYRAVELQIKRELDSIIATATPEDFEKPDVLTKGARLLMFQGKNLQASYVLTSLLEKDPNNLPAWLELGMARAKMKMADIFISEFPNPPAVAADAEPAWIQLSRLCATEGRWTESETYLASAPAQAQGLGLALVTLADFAAGMGQIPLANDFLLRARQEHPNDPVPWLKLTDLAMTANNLEVAQRALSEAERRGADASAVAERRAKIGTAPAEGAQTPAQEEEIILR